MKAKLILRVAYVVVALAVVAWLCIGAATWSAWRHHQEQVAANAITAASTVAPPVPVPGENFDRALSSVQYLSPEDLGADVPLPDWLAREMEVPADERSVGGWITFLRKEGVPVCWEIAPNTLPQTDVAFALPLERASVRDMLDALCRADRRYRWEWMKDSQIVNVLSDERLDVPLGDVSFRSKRLMYCTADLAPTVYLPWEYQKIAPQNYGNVFYWPVSIKAKQITVRDYLNLAVAQYEGMTWNAQGAVLELDAPQATRDAVVEKYRNEVPDEPVP